MEEIRFVNGIEGFGFEDDYPRTDEQPVQLPFPANLVATGRLTEAYARAIVDAGFTTQDAYEAARASYANPAEETDPRMIDLAVRLGRTGLG